MAHVGRPSSPFYRKDRDCWITRIDGKQITLAKGKANKMAALKEFYRIMTDGVPESPTKVTVKQVADYCIQWTRVNRTPNTIEGYERHLGNFVKSCGSMDASLVTPATINLWLSKHPTWGPVTRHGAIRHIKRAFNLANKHKVLSVNNVQGMENPVPPIIEEELREETITKIFAGIKSQGFREIITFIYETGCRPCEARVLEAHNMEIGHNVVTLIGKTTNQTRKIRRIYLSDKARSILEAQMEKYPVGPLFRNQQGNVWTRHAFTGQFDRIRKRTGVGKEGVARMLRKHWITDALERGVPIATVAELAGHQSTRMIENVYSKLSQRHTHLIAAVKTVRPDHG